MVDGTEVRRWSPYPWEDQKAAWSGKTKGHVVKATVVSDRQRRPLWVEANPTGGGRTNDIAMLRAQTGLMMVLSVAVTAGVVVLADRLGYFKSLFLGILLTAIGTWGFYYSDIHWVWIAANGLIGITWAYTIAYLLGLMSRFDTSGQMAALGGFASKMGLASGPAVAAMLLGENNYPLIIGVAVVALVLSMLAIMIPARVQDRSNA